MKKGLIIYLLFFAFLGLHAQQTKPIVAKDTVKTEVVEVITTYNPEIADANKIHKNPTIKLADKSKKKKLNYTIFSAPVASTFIPKSGVVKGIDVGVKERIYNNYVAAGFGNYTSPYFEAYLHNYTRFESEIGVAIKYAASLTNIEDTYLDSNFSNVNATVSYLQEERYFDWKFSLNTELSNYNWYGLNESAFTNTTLQNIEEKQAYKFFNATGEIKFIDSYIDKSNLSLSFFVDDYKSTEILADLTTNFNFPLDFISRNLNDLQLNTSLELLNGEFKSNYANDDSIEYAIFTAKINPVYNTTFSGFSVKLGAKFFASTDAENNVNNFLVYPDVKVQKSIIKEKLNIYTGLFGDLKTNSYKGFTEVNPYISPTLFLTQTAEKYNVFVGLNGVINNDLSFNISASYKEEQDKALFIRNNSKSNGTNNFTNGVALKGYEYGNSFSLIYDDVQTTSFFAELEYDVTKKLTLATNFQLDNFSLESLLEAWNLPTMQAAFTGKYKTNKWFATTNIFYVGERKDVLYGSTYPSNVNGVQTLYAFVDVNLNGGYHFNDKFSAFLKANNILNSDYQRFANFNVQGFQILGGITYKFDF